MRGWGLAGVLALVGCADHRPVVAVIGGGPAGMAAAIEAAACSAVTLFEARDVLGGSATYGDAVTAVPSAAALAALDAEAGHANPARARFVARVRPDVLDWFTDRGVHWRELPVHDPGATLYEPEGGGHRIGAVLEDATRAAGVHVRTGTRVDRLDRVAAGYRLAYGDDSVVAASVIIATGGFAGNLARVKEKLGLGDVPLLRGAAAFADGNGIPLGTGLGGVEESPAQAVLYAHGIPAADDPTRAVMLVDGAHVYPIDAAGVYLPEVQSPRGDSGAVLRARGGAGWVIFDRKGLDHIPLWDGDRAQPVPALPVAEKNGFVEPSIEALAADLHLPVASLLAGVAPRAAVASPPQPLLAGDRWAALPLRLTTAKTLTGLRIDLDGRLLDTTGHPIAGLYAAGELAGFAHPWESRHIDSTMVSGAVLTGRAAGRAVCGDR